MIFNPANRDAKVDLSRAFRLLLGGVFVLMFVNTAWVSDDAYIILRVVDNFVQGHGLRWNIAERVQGFTSPLWTLLLCGTCALTREYYFTTVLLSFLCAAGAVYLVGWRLASSVRAGLFGVAALVSSKAFMDYSSSGLENALGFLLLAVFFCLYRRPVTLRNLFLLSLVTALGATNRMDSVLLYGFPLAYSMWRAWRELRTRNQATGETRTVAALCKVLLVVCLGMLPFVAWEGFSLLYYGFPFPNTAYAKLHTGIPALKLTYRGLLYVLDSLQRDPVTLVLVGAVLVLTLWRGSWAARWAAAAVGLALLYTVRVGGDFMSGRFFALPFVAACAIGVQRRVPPVVFAVLTPLCLVLALFAERPTFLAHAGYTNKNRPRYIADERGYYYQWTGLWPVVLHGGEPRGPWIQAGKTARTAGKNVIFGGSIGLLGFYAGPDVHVIDRMALCDPLLSRMEVPDKEHWRIGHFERRVPRGYVETLESGENRIENPRLRSLHDVLVIVTREEIWTPGRMREILRLNLGAYNSLMEEF